jgi:uncharacterized protein
MALAENLGWPTVVKRLSYTKSQSVMRIIFGATLLGLKSEARASLQPPWPNLILGAGHPTEAVALWIKRYANPKVKMVFLGTPWANLNNFELVITTPQYQLPKRPNVLHNTLPMHKINIEKLKAAAREWQGKFKHLPKPWTGILVGGASGPYTFEAEAGARLAKAANAIGGSLLVTTSARTKPETTQALQAAISLPNYFHSWNDQSAENPFFGILAVADQFIVTADSISMLAEACATTKPVMLFDTENEQFSMRDGGRSISMWGSNGAATRFRLAMRFAPKRWSRDLRIVHQQLIKSGTANWLGEVTPLNAAPLPDDLVRATSRVKTLFNL